MRLPAGPRTGQQANFAPRHLFHDMRRRVVHSRHCAAPQAPAFRRVFTSSHACRVCAPVPSRRSWERLVPARPWLLSWRAAAPCSCERQRPFARHQPLHVRRPRWPNVGGWRARRFRANGLRLRLSCRSHRHPCLQHEKPAQPNDRAGRIAIPVHPWNGEVIFPQTRERFSADDLPRFGSVLISKLTRWPSARPGRPARSTALT